MVSGVAKLTPHICWSRLEHGIKDLDSFSWPASAPRMIDVAAFIFLPGDKNPPPAESKDVEFEITALGFYKHIID